MECKHFEIRSEVREQVRSVSERSYGPYLPNRDQLVAYFKGPSMEDTVGISVSDYADVDASVRDIFFIDESTLRDAADIYALAMASPLLNAGTMLGTSAKGVALYKSGTDQATLAKAQSYFKTLPGKYYHGLNSSGQYQTWTGYPVADYYVDSNISSSGDGTTPATAFKTIAELPTHYSGMIVGLVAGSYWREQLTLTSTGMKVFGCGVGRRPILDCADIVDNDAFSLADTNVYATTWTPETSGKNYPSVWEDGILLVRVTSLALCVSTPGSFYSSLEWDEGVPESLYVHASDSSNIITNGKVYESATREHGIVSSHPAEVYSVHGTRNKGNDGAIVLYSLNSYTENCIGSEGVVHNIFVAGRNNNSPKVSKDCVACLVDPTVPSTNFTSYQTSQLGIDLEYDNILAINYSDRASFPKASAVHAHGNVGAYRDVVVSGIASYATGLCGFDADTLIINNALAYNCAALYSGNMEYIEVNNSEWFLGNIYPAPTYMMGVWGKNDNVTIKCTNVVFNFYKYDAIHADKSSTIIVDRCTFVAGGVSEYFAIGGNKTSVEATTSLKITNSVFYGFRAAAQYFQMTLGSGHTVSIENNNNIFSNENTDFLCGSNINGGAVMGSVTSYLSVVGDYEANAYVGDPGFSGDPYARDYDMSGGSAESRGCGAVLSAISFDQNYFLTNIFPYM